jgi:hypothetical protein
MSAWLHVIVVVGCVLLTGCSTKYTVSSNTFVDYDAIPYGFDKGSSFCIASENDENVLFTKEVENKIACLLRAKGFEIVDADSAQYALVFDFSMSSYSKVINTLKHIPNQTQRTKGKISGNEGNSTKYEENTETSQAVYVPETHTFYDRKFTIEVCHNHDQKNDAPLWSGTFSSEGKSSDLRGIIDYLLIPAFENFGKSTGRCIEITLDEKDKQVHSLRNRWADSVR